MTSCCVESQIALWTSGFVIMTLVINAPLLPWVMEKTGISKVASVKRRMRAKAKRALVRFTDSAIEDLKDADDEMLRGACTTAPFNGPLLTGVEMNVSMKPVSACIYYIFTGEKVKDTMELCTTYRRHVTR